MTVSADFAVIGGFWRVLGRGMMVIMRFKFRRAIILPGFRIGDLRYL